MNLYDYTFVALDLETTGLDPERDTIIEVAALRYRLERDGDTYRAIEQEERSMLIDPGRKLEENIAMITGISDAMLIGKPKWEDVWERVAAFIGDSIIVGHNVLFDISMLASHGIDLAVSMNDPTTQPSDHPTIWPSHHPTILDTFELSEIFSQDAESLNLGFLGKKYQIEMESEHRALDDTKLSVELFCLYLSMLRKLDPEKQRLWRHASSRDSTGTIATLLRLAEIGEWGEAYVLPELLNETPDIEREPGEKKNTRDTLPITKSLSGDREELREVIRSSLETTSPLLYLTPSHKRSLSLVSLLEQEWYHPKIRKDVRHFCSTEMLSYWLEKPSWSRKETIFMIKMASWIRDTETWLLDELKYYGDERTLMELFRAERDEDSPFFARHRASLEEAPIVIADLFSSSIEKDPLIERDHSLIIEDIMSLEDILRKKQSHHISFEELFRLVSTLEPLIRSEIAEELIVALSMMRDISTSVPDRPKWEQVSPPGDYGETYLITQRSLWHRGGKWLALASEKLDHARAELSKITSDDIVLERYRKSILRDIEALVHIGLIESDNTNIMLTIQDGSAKIILIPRDVRETIACVIASQSGSTTTLLWYGIDNAPSIRFLEHECGIPMRLEQNNHTKILIQEFHIDLRREKTVILTTSMKHARMLAQELRWKHGIELILTQGLSGGKGKMLSLFQKSRSKSVLIGLIDTWMDEGDLWGTTDTVILAKVPFDPPTDPYFLARTAGMKNNFEEYSTPIAIHTLNTLIGRIHTENPKTRITCIDERLGTMNWGQNLKEYLL